MILVVTVNPLIEHRLTYPEVILGNSHRGPAESYQAGGKGINVSRQLNLLGIKNMSVTFLGGKDGKHLQELLHNEKINFTFTRINDNTRSSIVIIDDKKESSTTFFGANNRVTELEANELIKKLDRAIENCEMVVFSGSSPCEETDKIFQFGIKIANKYDKISLLDTYGKHLDMCLKCSPTIVHNNVDELESSLGITLNNEAEKYGFLDKLYSLGVKQAYITNGPDDSYASNFEFHYKVQNPKLHSIDSTGSGDAFVSGIVYSWHHNKTFLESLSIATALGAINSTRFDVCNVKPEEIEELKNEIQISSVGKKIKLIDDRPH